MYPYGPWFPPRQVQRPRDSRRILVLNPDVDPCDYFRRMVKTHGAVLVRYLPSINAISCYLPARSAVLSLRSRPEVSRIDYDLVLRIATYSRPRIAAVSGQEIPWGVERVRAPQAWGATKGTDVRVGIIDTGIDLSHPDLQANIAGGINVLKSDQPPLDDNGHGTHVAGTIAALNNDFGVVGVAPEAKLYAIKAFDADGTARVSDVIAGMEWCVANQIRLINFSFGSESGNESLRDAVRAVARHAILVAAAGNNGRADSVDVPARYPEVVAVAASTRGDQLASFTSRGPQVAVAAPGEEITSTWLDGGYSTVSGTSMATPHVTALFALLMRRHPGLSRAQLLEVVRSTADPLIGVSEDGGAGIVNAANAVSALGGGRPPRALGHWG